MSETQARRAEAETRLRPRVQRQAVTAGEIAAHIAEIGDIPAALAGAEPADKAQLYRELGLAMIYDPGASIVHVNIRLFPELAAFTGANVSGVRNPVRCAGRPALACRASHTAPAVAAAAAMVRDL